MSRSSRAWYPLLALLLGGNTACRVGPDFVRPAPPPVSGYSDTTGSGMPGDPPPIPAVFGQVIPSRWWQVFESPALDSLVAQGIQENQTLAAAQASLAQARELLRQARGSEFPQVDASASAARERLAAATTNASGSAANIYSVGTAASYPLDLFGGIRRKVEQAGALADNARYEVGAAYVTLSGNVVTTAITIASLRLQILTVNDILADDQRNLDLVQLKLAAGKAAPSDVLTAQSQLEADRALAPPIRTQLAQARHALAVLVGRFPAEWSAPTFVLDSLRLPDSLPASLPSELVHRRPDIQAAQAELHAASVAIGVAESQLYPSITLSGSLSSESGALRGLLEGPSFAWNLVAGMIAPLFHGGALRAQKRAAVDAYESSLALYRQTVMAAFQQVADVLFSLGADGQLVEAERRALEVSQSAVELQRIAYGAGKSSLLQLIDAQRTNEQIILGYARARAQRFQDVAELFVAMGGGWSEATGAGSAEAGVPH